MSNNHQPTDQRTKDIAALRALADLAERIPNLPLPMLSVLSHSLPGHTDESANALLDQAETALIAAGVEFTTTRNGHDRTLRIPIGAGTYTITQVWDQVMADFYARQSYADNVQVDEQPAGAVA